MPYPQVKGHCYQDWDAVLERHVYEIGLKKLDGEGRDEEVCQRPHDLMIVNGSSRTTYIASTQEYQRHGKCQILRREEYIVVCATTTTAGRSFGHGCECLNEGLDGVEDMKRELIINESGELSSANIRPHLLLSKYRHPNPNPNWVHLRAQPPTSAPSSFVQFLPVLGTRSVVRLPVHNQGIHSSHSSI
jgi:hypothetical protein